MNFFSVLFSGIFFCFITANSAWALNCRNPTTQADMTQCASSDLEHETNKINKNYNELRAKLPSAQKQELKDIQLAWIKFRDIACKFEASGVEGGSASGMVLSNCLTAKTVQRNKDLEALVHCEEGDLSCPRW